MPGTGSIQLARIFGIRIGVNASWFVVLFFFIVLLSAPFRQVLETSDAVAYLTAVASALLFFVSLVAHELGHALAARRQGIEISGIDLWFFGGIAKLSRDSQTPGEEFKIAVAGPLVTLAVVAACVGIGVATAGWDDFDHALGFRRGAGVTPPLLLLSWLATINSAVFVFNLVPAFPLDGGRIARALAWRVTGDRLRATRLAAWLGQAFSYLLIMAGVAELVLTGLGGAWSGLWWIFLGLFLGQAARAQLAQSAFAERIGDVRVLDIMDREPVAVPAELPARRAEEEFFLRYRWSWFPVVDAERRFVGIVRQQTVEDAVAQGSAERTVGELVDSDDRDRRIGEEAPLETLLGSEPLRRTGALMAVDTAGVLRGVVTIEQVRRALQTAVVPGRPAS